MTSQLATSAVVRFRSSAVSQQEKNKGCPWSDGKAKEQDKFLMILIPGLGLGSSVSVLFKVPSGSPSSDCLICNLQGSDLASRPVEDVRQADWGKYMYGLGRSNLVCMYF